MITSETQKMRLLLKDCAAGFYQQMYFLGKDVSHFSGNQLMEYGFLKSPSTGLNGTSCYTYTSESKTVELYGSCAALYTDTSKVVFLRERCRFYLWLPDHNLVAGEWSHEDLQIETPESVFHHLAPLLHWWVKYEKWIELKHGEGYRERCFKDWKKLKSKPAWLSPDRATQWVAGFIEEQETQVRPKYFA
jgi:hypothetical protein